MREIGTDETKIAIRGVESLVGKKIKLKTHRGSKVRLFFPFLRFLLFVISRVSYRQSELANELLFSREGKSAPLFFFLSFFSLLPRCCCIRRNIPRVPFVFFLFPLDAADRILRDLRRLLLGRKGISRQWISKGREKKEERRRRLCGGKRTRDIILEEEISGFKRKKSDDDAAVYSLVARPARISSLHSGRATGQGAR